MLGLPDGVRTCLFDLDGVLTQTAKVHAKAWKQMFDAYLEDRARRRGEQFVPFDPVKDYDEYVDGLGNRKNEIVLKLIHDEGVQPYEGSVRYVHAVREAGLHRAVVSSSTNCHDVLRAAGIDGLFDAVIDGVVAEREHLS